VLEKVFKASQQASRELAVLDHKVINNVLMSLADSIEQSIVAIQTENEKDLVRMHQTDPKYDRLRLTDKIIRGIAADIRKVAALPSPLNISLEKKTLENGLHLEKISVPLGVIGIIYEARPNVTFDVFSLCLKSGNACLLKGGSDAEFSNLFIASLIKQVLEKHGVNENVIALLPVDRQATHELLNAVGYVDIIIPRGSQALIDYVRNNSKVPVIETGAGIVHTYFDKSGDLKKGADIIFNSKTRRVSVCNALDCLIIQESRLADLPLLTGRLKEKNVRIFADESAYKVLEKQYPSQLLDHASEQHFGTEFLDYKMSVKTVADLNGALDHIAKYSSKHSEAIIAEDESVIDTFLKNVDAAAVYANTSTAFTDGGQFGLGAEIGISTQKLHARGPMALREMTSYKWLIRGEGQIRP
jgi:glutamate-5-semialdehyde dehydrogenase